MPASSFKAGSPAIATTLAVMLTASAASAQPPDPAAVARAEQSFDEGMVAWKAGDLATAETKLRAAHAIVKTPITGLPLAKVMRDENKWLEARALLDQVAALPDYPNMSAQARADRDEAKVRAAAIAKETPTLVVRFAAPQGAPRDRSVVIDGRPHSFAEVSAPMPMDPGEHAVSVVGGATACAGGTVHLAPNEKRTLTWEVADQRAAPSAEGHPSSSLPWVGFGIAVGGAAVGSVFGLIAFDKASTLRAECTNHTCPASAHDDVGAAKVTSLVSTLAFGTAIAGAALGIGAVLASSPTSSDVVAPACSGPHVATSSTPATRSPVAPGPARSARVETRSTRVASGPSLVVSPFGIGGAF